LDRMQGLEIARWSRKAMRKCSERSGSGGPSTARCLELGHLFFEFNLAGGGELIEDLSIHKQLRVRFRRSDAFRDAPGGLVERAAPGVSSQLQIHVDRI